jgi:hypothetical protein
VRSLPVSAITTFRHLLTITALLPLVLASVVELRSTAACAPDPSDRAPWAEFDPPYRTDFGTPQHEDCAVHSGVPLDFGELTEPPTAERAATSTADDIDVIAHWYNDFGLDGTLGSAGWNGWYDWRWNFPTNRDGGSTGSGLLYDPARHPALGFYKGDDPRALGWIAYWLRSAGVRAVSFPQEAGFTTDGWGGSTRDWLEQYLEHTPNSDALDYVLPIGTRGGPAEIERRAVQLVDTVRKHPHVSVFAEDGKRYATVNAWDLESLRGQFDGYANLNAPKTVAFLRSVASSFRGLGYDGVAVLARRSGVLGQRWTQFVPDGIRIVGSTYDGRYADGETYETYADYTEGIDYDSIPALQENAAIGTFTALETTFPHPSGYRLAGSTPQLFRKQLDRARAHIDEHGLPRLMTVYNVSEWAEGGPGLIPNARDGFGYLEALRRAIAGEPEPAASALPARDPDRADTDAGTPRNPTADRRTRRHGTGPARTSRRRWVALR